MSAQTEFLKALKYLDSAMLGRAEECLLSAIDQAKTDMDESTLIRASCCYGDFLVNAGRADEAISFLKHVADLDSNSTLYDYEINRARKLLEAI